MSSKTLCVDVPVFCISQHADNLAAELSKLPPDDTQIIVVDDGPPDGSADFLAGLEMEMHQLTAIKCAENGGAGVARNIGFPMRAGIPRCSSTATTIFTSMPSTRPSSGSKPPAPT